MIPEVAALMKLIKVEGAFNVLAKILADTSELIFRLDEETGGKPEGDDKLAKSNAMADGESLCDGLIEAMTRLPSDGVGGAVVHIVLASDMLNIADSWVDQDEPSERGKVRMEEALDAAIRSLTFALPELLALPEAKLARRIARRYVAGMREQLKEKAAS